MESKEKREREGEKREKWEKQREGEGAREAHWRACFIKVQVQDLSDCQAALSFWFHINIVSFLPSLSSPALLHSSPRSAVCSFSSAPLTPRHRRKRRGKFGWNFLASHSGFFSFSSLNVSHGNKNKWLRVMMHGATDRMSLISGESADLAAATLSITTVI